MRLFYIRGPIKGTFEIYVWAETKAEAVEIASDTLNSDNIMDWEEDFSQADVVDETPHEVEL